MNRDILRSPRFSLQVCAIFFLSVLSLFTLYHRPLSEPSEWFIGDDNRAYENAMDGFSLEDVLKAHGDHLVPVYRAFRYGLHLALGPERSRYFHPAFGFLLLALLAGTGTAMSAAVLWVGGSWWIALSLSLMVINSFVASTAVVGGFCYSAMTWTFISLVAAALLLDKFLNEGSRIAFWAFVVVHLTCTLLHGPGIFMLFVPPLFIAGLYGIRALRDATLRTRVRKVAIGSFFTLAVYLCLLIAGHRIYGNRLPGNEPTPDRPNVALHVRAPFYLAYQAFGWVLPYGRHVNNDNGPSAPLVFNFRWLLVGIELLIAGLLGRKLMAGSVNGREAISIRFVLTFLAAGVLFSLLATLGRSYLYFWDLRYMGYGIVFHGIAWGILASLLLARRPPYVQSLLGLALLLAVLGLSEEHRKGIRKSPYYVSHFVRGEEFRRNFPKEARRADADILKTHRL